MARKGIFFVAIILTYSIQIIKCEELYCKNEAFNFNICRRCTDINQDCETTTNCQCNHIELYDKRKGKKKLVGGSNCETTASKGNWCFVTGTSTCADKKVSNTAKTFDNLWLKNEVFISYDACKQENRQSIEINQEVMNGVKITEDILKGSDGYSNNPVPLQIETGDHLGCKEECEARCGKCGAWSFDDINGLCYLHTIDACCGQVGKRQPDTNFISGYHCPQCSSSQNDCPCSLKQRLKGDFDCSSTEFGDGATTPEYTGSSGLLRVDTINTNQDPCACERRKMRRRCKCVKPRCHDEYENPNGTCKDNRRCRSRALNPRRFPYC